LIREAVNNLLPVAGIGGEVVGARLLARHGMPLGLAGATATVDLTVEMVTQILFTLAGLGLLLIGPHDRAVASWVAVGLAIALLAAAAFVAAQRSGLFKLIELGLLRLAERWPGLSLDGIRGLHDSVRAIHAHRRGLLAGAACHGIAWVLGAAEVWVALAALGHPVGLREAFVIESLGAALRSAGFAVPGALGVQEAALILVCSPFGVPAETAVALSMVKRVRELAFGLTGLIAWQWSEGRRLAQVISSSHGVRAIAKSMRGSR
jgi:putative membrane protein